MTFIKTLKSSAAAIGLTVSLFGAYSVQAQTAPVVTDAPAPVVATPIVPASGEGPALWVVRDADSTLYLFGTVHILRPTTGWGSAKVDTAFDSADQVWFEISNPDDQASVIPLVQQYGLSPEAPLSGRLNAEEMAQLEAAAQVAGLTAAQMEPFRPWFAALTLSIAPLTKAGYDPQSGVELILKARAEAAGKPVSGLETIDEQIRILATMPEDAQMAFLRSTLEDFEEATTVLDTMVEAWSNGDVETLNRIAVVDMKTETPDIYEALLVRRNANWAGQIKTLLDGSGTAFIAVGAAHLAGEDSVQAKLAELGITATRQ